jgi:hypothetical protein
MKKTKQTAPIGDELIDAWLKQGRKPEDIQGLLKQFTKQVVERAMQGEMAEHLGYEKHDPDGNNSGNGRNGTAPKTLKGDLVRWNQRRRDLSGGSAEDRQEEPDAVGGFDDRSVMYSVDERSDQGHLEEMYGVKSAPA